MSQLQSIIARVVLAFSLVGLLGASTETFQMDAAGVFDAGIRKVNGGESFVWWRRLAGGQLRVEGLTGDLKPQWHTDFAVEIPRHDIVVATSVLEDGQAAIVEQMISGCSARLLRVVDGEVRLFSSALDSMVVDRIRNQGTEVTREQMVASPGRLSKIRVCPLGHPGEAQVSALTFHRNRKLAKVHFFQPDLKPLNTVEVPVSSLQRVRPDEGGDVFLVDWRSPRNAVVHWVRFDGTVITAQIPDVELVGYGDIHAIMVDGRPMVWVRHKRRIRLLEINPEDSTVKLLAVHELETINTARPDISRTMTAPMRFGVHDDTLVQVSHHIDRRPPGITRFAADGTMMWSKEIPIKASRTTEWRSDGRIYVAGVKQRKVMSLFGLVLDDGSTVDTFPQILQGPTLHPRLTTSVGDEIIFASFRSPTFGSKIKLVFTRYAIY